MATNAQFWEGTDYGPGNTNAKYEFLNARSPNRYYLMRLLRKAGMRETGEILKTLLDDSTPAASASVSISQLTAEADPTSNVQGGVRTIAAKERMGLTINSDKDDAGAATARNVSAGDVTALLTELIPSGSRATRSPSTYPADLSGNGGGGKLS